MNVALYLIKVDFKPNLTFHFTLITAKCLVFDMLHSFIQFIHERLQGIFYLFTVHSAPSRLLAVQGDPRCSRFRFTGLVLFMQVNFNDFNQLTTIYQAVALAARSLYRLFVLFLFVLF